MATKQSNTKKRKFIQLLHELFQLNQPELDFGIYRIMHARKDDINRFVETDLPKIIADAFDGFQNQDKQQVQQELEKLTKSLTEAGVDPTSSPKYQELQDQLANNLDLGREEGEVYDALITFFSRYYDEGDFVSRRVYKDGTYAIPYNGEEVVLHWANKDQYYIKSTETLRDYSFRLDPNNEENPMRVHFKLVDADPGAQNNVKETEASKRIFILDGETPWQEVDGDQGKELQLRFHYRATSANDWTATAKAAATAAAAKKSPTQDHCRQIAVEALLGDKSDLPTAWKNALNQPYTKADGEQADYPILEGQLNKYTKKNTFDYFIHKDLGGFLTRELDFYIKNELMRWEDIAALKSQPARLAPLLSKVEVIRAIGGKIIAFLAQLEEFQKKLWLKKKFVTEANYCITLDRIPASLYDEIISNEQQYNEWVRLGFTEKETKITKEFLENNPFLVLDTVFFHEKDKGRFLAAIDELDRQCDGVAINSDNYQALRILCDKYQGRVDCVYIDPPFNTGNDGFIYKDGYKDSSWISLQNDRNEMALRMLSPHGLFFVSIGNEEDDVLGVNLDGLFGRSRRVGKLVWKSRISEDTRSTTGLSEDHEYILAYRNSNQATLRGVEKDLNKFTNPDNDPRGPWRSADLTGLLDKNQRPNLHYDLINPETGINYGCPLKGWRYEPSTMMGKMQEGRILWPAEEAGRPRHKMFLNELKSRYKHISSVIQDVSTAEGTRELNAMFGLSPISFPKPMRLVQKIIEQAGNKFGVFLDYFAGSGTSGCAVIEENRRDSGSRKYVLVEAGEHFTTALKPRIQKSVFSRIWKEGKAMPDGEGNLNGISHCFKYIHLESYEDALSNLKLSRDKAQQDLLVSQSAEDQAAREAYLLNYMLDVETRGSDSLLNVSKFIDPTRYQLMVRNPTGDETRMVDVDLLETFNWLIGLTVEYIAAPIYFDAELSQAEHGRWQTKVKRAEDGRWWFRTVVGETRKGQKVLIVWRNLPSVIDKEDNGLVKDNAVLDAVLIDKLKIGMSESPDDEFDILYVNGDHNITIPKKRNGELLEARVKLIEEDFHRLMFSTDTH